MPRPAIRKETRAMYDYARTYYPRQQRWAIRYRLPDGTWYPQGEQPENDLLNDYHHAEYAQIFDAKNRSDEWYTP